MNTYHFEFQGQEGSVDASDREDATCEIAYFLGFDSVDQMSYHGTPAITLVFDPLDAFLEFGNE